MNGINSLARWAVVFLISLAAGCQQSPSTTEAATKALAYRSLTHDERPRHYYLHVPSEAARQEGYALIIVLHGGLGNPLHVAKVTGFHQAQYPLPTIVVYPAGTGRLEEHLLTWNAGSCCGYAQRNDVDDVGFLSRVIDDLRKEYPIDEEKIAISGHSNGGMMAYRMACERADTVRSIGVVASTMAVDETGCKPSRAVSVFHIHGEKDQNVPIVGGRGEKSIAGVQYRAVDETLSLWRGFNHCDQSPQQRDDEVAAISQYGCAQASRLWDIRIHEGSHKWQMAGLYDATHSLVNAIFTPLSP